MTNILNRLAQLICFFKFLLQLQASNAFVPHKYASSQKRLSIVQPSPLSGTTDDRSHLYRQEPTELEREVLEKEEGNPKHSTYHVERGPDFVLDKSDVQHSIHHHLIDVDHDKINDLNMRAQKAWLPVNVHEMELDAMTVAVTLFGLLALLLFTVQ